MSSATKIVTNCQQSSQNKFQKVSININNYLISHFKILHNRDKRQSQVQIAMSASQERAQWGPPVLNENGEIEKYEFTCSRGITWKFEKPEDYQCRGWDEWVARKVFGYIVAFSSECRFEGWTRDDVTMATNQLRALLSHPCCDINGYFRDPGLPPHDRTNFLHTAVFWENLEAVKLLLEDPRLDPLLPEVSESHPRIPPDELPYLPDRDETLNAFQKAMYGASAPICLAFIKSGRYDINVSSHYGTPLTRAIRRRSDIGDKQFKDNLSIVSALLKCNDLDINVVDADGICALQVALGRADVAVVDALLQRSDIQVCGGSLCEAMTGGFRNTQVVNRLLAKFSEGGFPEHINRRDRFGESVLHFAAHDTLLTLLRIPALNLNAANRENETVLHSILHREFNNSDQESVLAVLEFIVNDKRADMQILLQQDDNEQMPFDIAFNYGAYKVAEGLFTCEIIRVRQQRDVLTQTIKRLPRLEMLPEEVIKMSFAPFLEGQTMIKQKHIDWLVNEPVLVLVEDEWAEDDDSDADEMWQENVRVFERQSGDDVAKVRSDMLNVMQEFMREWGQCQS